MGSLRIIMKALNIKSKKNQDDVDIISKIPKSA